MRGVLQDHDRGLAIMVDGEVAGAVQDHGVAVPAIQLGQVVPALDSRRVRRHCYHILGNGIVGEQVEELVPVESLLDDVEKGLQSLEVVVTAIVFLIPDRE
jgi:hypothetical protein